MTAETIEVANTILTQLGRGNKNALAVMTGARNLMARNEARGALSFRLPTRTANGCNFVKVTLEASDTYTVEFGRVWGHKYTVISTHNDIYCDVLADLFERQTGLYLSFR